MIYKILRALVTCFTMAATLALPAAFAATVPTPELLGALHWRSVGPYSGGRVTTVAGVPGEPNLYYAGYAGSGVWETDNYGISWKNITDKYFKPDTSGSVGALAIAPSDPKIIYVGTGDSAPRNTVITGHGMYKSTDAGKTWKYVGLGKTHIITWILVDPKNANVVYVGALGHLFAPNAQRGVFKSTDGGRTWKKILYVNDQTGVATMAMDPKNPQVLYVAMWQMTRRPWTFASGGPGSGIYKTTDGGATWRNITHNEGLPTGVFGKVGLVVAPSNPNVVYALVQAKLKDGAAGGLFRSGDGGKTWKLVNTSMKITQRAFYYMRVYVDPKNADTVYFPNVDFFVSRDGGKKLTKIRTPHGDNHALWINPDDPQTMIEGNDGGAAISLTGGSSWSSEMNQPTGQFYHANLDNEFPFDIYGGQQDRGSVMEPSAVPFGKIPPAWKAIIGGEMSWVVPSPTHPDVSYGSGYYSKQWAENRSTLLMTNVSAWAADKFGLEGAKIKYRFGWKHHPVVFAPADPNELLIGANVVFESMDGGQHWKVISPDLTRNDKSKQQRPGGPISADVTGEEMFDTLSVVAGSPLAAGIIWTGSDDGLVYVTTDGGEHWSEVRPHDLPKWSTITSITPSFTRKGTAYLSASRYMWDDFEPYVYKTTDFGKHWTRITAGLPDDEYVEAVRQDPDQPNLLFAGTSASAYVSFDDGAHWISLALNLPTVKVTDVEIQPEQHAVVISTFGRGFWVLDNLQFLEQVNATRVAGDAAYLFKPQQTWLVVRSQPRSPDPNAPGGQNLRAGATVFFHLPKDYDGTTPLKLTFTYPDGRVINSFTLHREVKSGNGLVVAAKGPKKSMALHAGMNRVLWNLRYPDATEIKGVFHSGFSAAKPIGPEVMPGTYDVVLSYGKTTQKQSFAVKLDPRVHTTQPELEQRFALAMKIHEALDALDAEINQAVVTQRNAVKTGLDKGKLSGDAAQSALANLDRDIDGLVDLRIQSNEGALVYPPRLRAWLSSIASQVGFAPVAPTPAMQEAADTYIAKAHAGVARLRVDINASAAVMDAPRASVGSGSE